MKASTGLIELVIIVALMCAGIPMFLTLMDVCSTVDYEYANDKTLVDKSSYLDYEIITNDDGVSALVPVDKRGLNIAYGDALITTYIQDDCCPESARKVVYDMYTDNVGTVFEIPKNRADTLLTTKSADLSSYMTAASDNYINFTVGWDSVRMSEMCKIYNHIYKGSIDTVNGVSTKLQQSPVYMVWSTENNCWVFTYNNFGII